MASTTPPSRTPFPIGRLLRLFFAWFMAVALAACGGGGGGEDGAAVAFAVQPTDVSVVEGNALVLTVVVTGDAALQWQRLLPGGWSDLAGATSARYTQAVVQGADSGAQFRVVATSRQNPALQIVSSVVTLTVPGTPLAPAITVQPVPATSVDGQEISFSVTVTGTSPSYRWQRSTAGADWADIAGATTPTITLRVTLADNGAEFRVVVTNGSGIATSTAVQLRVSAAAAPSFVVSPSDAVTATGLTASFHAVAVGAPAPTLRWQTSTDGAAWTDAAGASGPNFSIAQVASADDGKYVRAIATNQTGDVASAPVRLFVRVQAPPVVLVQPQDASVGLFRDAVFSIQASGVPGVAYQWQFSTDGGTTFSNINGETTAELRLRSVQPSLDGWRVRATVANLLGTVTSATAQLRIIQAPVITLQPASTTWRPGQFDALFTASASGADVQYQWQLSSDQGASWVNAPGERGTSYVHAANASASVNAVRLVASNGAGSTASLTGRLDALRWQTVAPAPTGATLTAVAWRDASTVFATGAAGTILRSADAGSSWSVVSEGYYGFPDTTRIAFDADGVGITTPGQGALIKRSVDGGLHWASVQIPSIYGSGAVAATNTGAFCLADDNGTILRSTDAGLSWQAAVSDTFPVVVKGMAFNTDGVGIIVGNGGIILRSINGGANWQRVPGAAVHLAAVAFASRNVVFVGGANGTLMRSDDAGQTWQSAASGTTLDILGLHFGSASNGVLSLPQGLVRVTTDGGSNWNPATVPANDIPLLGVGIGPTGNAVAVGMYGNILRSTDSGQSWSKVTGGALDQGLLSAAFSTPSNGIAAGDGGSLLRSIDGGRTWASVVSGGTASWRAAGFFDAVTGVVLGSDGSVRRTTNGGASWAPAVSGNGVSYRGFARVDAATAVAATDNGLSRTTDAGLTWGTVLATPLLQTRAVAFNGAQTGVAVGAGGTIHRSVDGGQTWSPTASGTVKDLKAVTFASSGIAIAVGVDGVVLRSTDAGITWQPGQFPFFSDTWFYGVAFSSPTTGAAVGTFGTVMLTRDAGATWQPDYTQRIGGIDAVAAAGAQGFVAVGVSGVITLIAAP